MTALISPACGGVTGPEALFAVGQRDICAALTKVPSFLK